MRNTRIKLKAKVPILHKFHTGQKNRNIENAQKKMDISKYTAYFHHGSIIDVDSQVKEEYYGVF